MSPLPTTDLHDRLAWLRCCNGVTREFVGEPRVDLAIEAQAQRTPDALAIGGAERLTYAELDTRANRLAHCLRQRGAQTSDLIGIQLERGTSLVVAVLATLKTGCTYVPLDPAYPAERLDYMRAAARTRLTVVATADRTSVDQVSMDDASLATLPGDAPPTGARTADALIYVIFTSGSTGQPKGAGVTQRGFINLMRWFIDEFSITARDRVLLMSSFSFDLTQKNLFAPMMTGGQLHFAANGPYEPSALARQIQEAAITLINCTPSAFYPLANAADPTRLRSLRIAFLGGEPIATRRLAAWQQANSFRCEVANTYGPTECTDICVFHRLSPAEYAPESTNIPIGRPVPNTAIAILDEAGQPCLPDEVGELCVTGVGVGVGYVNDAALTAEKFITNPFPDLPGDRLYRTGDLARWRQDQRIDYLGRIDHQVKIRGFRVELGEIEAALERHPDIGEAVVVARPTPAGDGKRLVAYVVLRAGSVQDTNAWRAHVAKLLPEHMVPSAWVVLPTMPLSPNGKVDRRALPEPASDVTAPKTNLTDNEQSIAAIWCRVLGTSGIDPETSYFDLGASSLQVAEAHAELERLHPSLPITALFQFPSVRSLARHLGATGPLTASDDAAERARRQLAARRRPPGRTP
jgi:amino acid adenylation domain-containing protein